MIQNLIVAAIVATAALWLGRRWWPKGLRARVARTPTCPPKACGKSDCGGCH